MRLWMCECRGGFVKQVKSLWQIFPRLFFHASTPSHVALLLYLGGLQKCGLLFLTRQISRLGTRIKECIRVESHLVRKPKRQNESEQDGRGHEKCVLGTSGRSEFFWRIWAKLILIQPERWWSIHDENEACWKTGGSSTGVLTCKSMLTVVYRGEILIESFSCWFSSKFPPG